MNPPRFSTNENDIIVPLYLTIMFDVFFLGPTVLYYVSFRPEAAMVMLRLFGVWP